MPDASTSASASASAQLYYACSWSAQERVPVDGLTVEACASLCSGDPNCEGFAHDAHACTLVGAPHASRSTQTCTKSR